MSRFAMLDKEFYNSIKKEEEKHINTDKTKSEYIVKPICDFEKVYKNKYGKKRFKNCLDSECHENKKHFYNKRVVYRNGQQKMEKIMDCPKGIDCWLFHQKDKRGRRICQNRHPIRHMKTPCNKGNSCNNWSCGLRHTHPVQTCDLGPNCYYADHPNDNLLCRLRHGDRLKPLCENYTDCNVYGCDEKNRHHPDAPFDCRDGDKCQNKNCLDKHPNAKLTNENVVQIKKMLLCKYRPVDICKLFGVKDKTIYNIKENNKWKGIVVTIDDISKKDKKLFFKLLVSKTCNISRQLKLF